MKSKEKCQHCGSQKLEEIDEEKVRQELFSRLLKVNSNFDGYIWIQDNDHTPPNNWTRIPITELAKEITKKFGRPRVDELVKACKEFVQWFDYISAYQHENLCKGLKEAEDNWGSMVTPSPPIDKMKKALKNHEEGE